MTRILVLIALLNTGELRTGYYSDSLMNADGRRPQLLTALRTCQRDAEFLNALKHVVKAWCATVEPVEGPDWEPVQ